MSPPGLDLDRLRAHLEAERPGMFTGPLRGELIHGGHSNLTYRVTDGRTTRVVRRPPLGHVLPTAHNMAREFRVISALGPTVVPVPPADLLCDDEDVVGAPFYVMAEVPGTVYRAPDQAEQLGPERVLALSRRLVDVLADLHELDPAAVGLGDLGRPAGYLERQLTRWRAQLDASRSRPLEGIEELHERLTARVPAGRLPPAILHGDYRLDNALVDDGDQITAVVDWEMSTLGDPLADVGLFLVYWDRATAWPEGGLATAVRPELGFPSGAELSDRYARRRGIDLSGLSWYRAFGCFKVAVILEGIHYRYVAGQTVGPDFERLGNAVPQLVRLGRETLTDGE